MYACYTSLNLDLIYSMPLKNIVISKFETVHFCPAVYETGCAPEWSLNCNDDMSVHECVLCVARIEEAQNKCAAYNGMQRKPGTISQRGRGTLRNMIQASSQKNPIRKLLTKRKKKNYGHKIFPMGPSIKVHMYCSEEEKNTSWTVSVICFHRRALVRGVFSTLPVASAG